MNLLSRRAAGVSSKSDVFSLILSENSLKLGVRTVARPLGTYRSVFEEVVLIGVGPVTIGDLDVAAALEKLESGIVSDSCGGAEALTRDERRDTLVVGAFL